MLVMSNSDFDGHSSHRWARGAQQSAANQRVRADARYDNSSFNAFNPDPSLRVEVGQETIDEMMCVSLFNTLDQEQFLHAADLRTGVAH